MNCTAPKGLHLSPVLFLFSAVLLYSLSQPTLTSRLPQPLPTPQNGQDFGEDLELKAREVSVRPGKLSSHGLEFTAETTPKMHHLDTTSESPLLPSTVLPPETSSDDFVSISPQTPAEHPRMEDEYPKDIVSLEERRRGWVTLHVIGVMYMFVSLAVVCNEFFVPAAVVITDMLALSEDVAGATIVAAGRSTPKFFAILIGVLMARTDVGFGSIVGPALYNVLFVIGVSALLSRKILHLNRWPVFRDASFYTFCLVVLIIFFLDDVIMWWESVMLLGCYAVYVTFMKFDAQIARVFKSQDPKHKSSVELIPVEYPRKDDLPAGENGSEGFTTEEYDCKNHSSDSRKNEDDETSVKEEEEDAKEDKPLSLKWPDTSCERGAFLFLLPVIFSLWLTLPDVRNQKSRRFCVITFLGSIVWICVFTYLALWWGHQVGQTFGIPDFLSVLVAGTANAELLASVIVARRGLADMAVSSSVGSNIFDVTVGLALPWLLHSSIYGAVSVAVSNKGLICAITLLFLMLFLAVIVIVACEWKMNAVLGSSLVLLYIIFLVLSFLLQYGVILCPVSV